MTKLIPYFIIILVSLFVQIVPSGPDANLYFGLGQNLLNDIGYIDNIRNDEILPSIGYPFIIMLALKLGMSGKIFAKIVILSSFFLLFESFKNLKINPLIAMLVSILLINILPPFNIWGMEIVLLFSIVFLFYASTLLIQKQNTSTLLFFTFALLLNILIRPILMPFIYLLIPFIVYYIVKYKYLRKSIIFSLSIFILVLAIIGFNSYNKYDDKRYLSGTYSEIPLYCAWNDYIDLGSRYYSSRWAYVPKDLKEEATKPLQNTSGWENRAKLLREKVIEFVLENPKKAFDGYVWRLSKFTYASDVKSYIYLLYIWIFIILIISYKIKKMNIQKIIIFLFFLLLALYIISVTSVFIYVGPRYLLTPSLFLIISIAYFIYIIKTKEVKKTKKVKKTKNKVTSILIASNLNVWSIKKGIGAPSFYKTLELYNDKKFKVYFYTTEDNCNIQELTNIKIIKLPKLKIINIRYIYTIHRLINYILYQFIFLFFYFFKQKDKIDFIYGYEIEFIPSLKLLSKIIKKPFISRFQGTILYPLMQKRLWRLRYFPHYFSIKQKSDLTIMTDDGTQGKMLIEKLRGSSIDLLFIKNGVDFVKVNHNIISRDIKDISKSMVNYNYNFISVSRLEKWKRVDRSINIFKEFQKKYKSSRYIIVGDGSMKQNLEEYVSDNNLTDNIIFTGGIDANSVNYLMTQSDIFLSHYELSNVGNPLWEAIKNNCLIVTINNGDTGIIIQDGYNGIISDENVYLENVDKLIKSKNNIEQLIVNSKITLKENIVSWNQRMEIEYQKVISL